MDIYLIIVIVLIVLAVSDLIVGVSNDAVNFLNSAVGSRVAPMWVILLVASLGVLIGTTFSVGMMEVARKGIFHPDQFYFSEIMLIFLAVMITDILLLDLYNTFGMPTSTTVSLVFELLGAAVAMSVIKISQSSETLLDIGKYINSEKALAIISGILISVILAFIAGTVIQYISRLIFSFNYHKPLRYFGSLWGGIAITAITYFMLIQGAKGASFISPDQLVWIEENTVYLIFISLAGWTILMQLANWIFKVNILSIIVLVGTFALAMAFAGNDLVNFIGVPLAGLKSYEIFTSSPGADPGNFLMGALAEPVSTGTLLLLLAGAIMIFTLWVSKKAKTVIATEVNLGRQSSGYERFNATPVSRQLVRSVLAINRFTASRLPKRLLKFLNARFEPIRSDRKKSKTKDEPSFDLIRASVNLVVSSILIALGTSLKLPLSTTYVTFMVAMGTSLSDRAWGRESAVYRIQGVFLVIGGWFLTALIAFTVAFVFANIIYWGKMIAIVIILALSIYMIYRTHLLHRTREKEKSEDENEFGDIEMILSASGAFEKCQGHTVKLLSKVPVYYEDLVRGLSEENRQLLKDLRGDIRKYNKKIKKIKDNVNMTVISLHADQIDTGHYYVQSVDYLREIAHCLNFMVAPAFEHIDNNHEGLTVDQNKELSQLNDGIRDLFSDIIQKIETNKYEDLELIISKQQELLNIISDIRKNQVKRIKDKQIQTRRSLLYLDLLAESKNLLLFSINLLKSQRDFIVELQKK